MQIIFYLLVITLNILFFFNLNKISKLLNIYDLPDFKRKIHKVKTPQIGGIILFSNFCLYLIFDKFYFNELQELSYFIIFFSTFFIFLIGIFDDKYNVNAKLKGILFIIIFFLTIYFEKNLLINNLIFSINELTINTKSYSILFTIICLFLFVNAFNMFDGINGQIGIYIIIIFSYLIYKNLYLNFSIWIIISLLFFLYFNLKGKIFIGDNGSLLISFLFALLIINTNNQNLNIFADEIFILMMLPGIDMARLFIERIYNGKNPLKADNNHFHHILFNKRSKHLPLLVNSCLIFFPIIAFSLGVNSFLIIAVFIFFYFTIILFARKKKFKLNYFILIIS